MNQLILTFQKKNTVTPIWFMRQAGRYLPEYQKIRKEFSNFLELCYDIEKAVEITLLPIKRYDLNAVILFSDILVLFDILGWKVEFRENIGPILNTFENKEDFSHFNNFNDEKIYSICNIISKIKKNISNNMTLIGFAGSPWTMLAYLFSGGNIKNFIKSRKFIHENRKLALELVDFLTKKTTHYLMYQINAGIDLIQLFDSWAGLLEGQDYFDFIINPTKKIISSLKKDFPTIPIIGFPRGSGFYYDDYIKSTGIDAISVDEFIPLYKMKEWSNKIVVQGNLNPLLLFADRKILQLKTHELLNSFNKKNFIFNLGHGILPDTCVEKISNLIYYIRSF